MYVSAYEFLDLNPDEVMMCACHSPDVEAARSNGLRTGFIYRPNEFGNGPVGVPDKAEPGDFDLVSTSIIDLAQQIWSLIATVGLALGAFNLSNCMPRSVGVSV